VKIFFTFTIYVFLLVLTPALIKPYEKASGERASYPHLFDYIAAEANKPIRPNAITNIAQPNFGFLLKTLFSN